MSERCTTQLETYHSPCNKMPKSQDSNAIPDYSSTDRSRRHHIHWRADDLRRCALPPCLDRCAPPCHASLLRLRLRNAEDGHRRHAMYRRERRGLHAMCRRERRDDRGDGDADVAHWSLAELLCEGCFERLHLRLLLPCRRLQVLDLLRGQRIHLRELLEALQLPLELGNMHLLLLSNRLQLADLPALDAQHFGDVLHLIELVLELSKLIVLLHCFRLQFCHLPAVEAQLLG
mmetsp:Transcript_116276/g.301422  ORF Transcript_116276/g.301422 Transcript_116276/m.301422 type:complete len:232 (+) Transcript_116276:451-1146(+)